MSAFQSGLAQGKPWSFSDQTAEGGCPRSNSRHGDRPRFARVLTGDNPRAGGHCNVSVTADLQVMDTLALLRQCFTTGRDSRRSWSQVVSMAQTTHSGGRRRRVSSRPMRFRAPDGIDCRCPIRPLPQAASEAPRETLGIDGSTDFPHEGTSSGGSPPPDP